MHHSYFGIFIIPLVIYLCYFAFYLSNRYFICEYFLYVAQVFPIFFQLDMEGLLNPLKCPALLVYNFFFVVLTLQSTSFVESITWDGIRGFTWDRPSLFYCWSWLPLCQMNLLASFKKVSQLFPHIFQSRIKSGLRWEIKVWNLFSQSQEVDLL